MKNEKGKVKFIRVRGRVIPVRAKGSKTKQKDSSKKLKSAGYGETVKSNRRAYKKDLKTKKGRERANKHSKLTGLSLLSFAAPLAHGKLMASSQTSGHAARKAGKDLVRQIKKSGRSSVKTSSKLKFAGLFAKHKATRGLANASKFGFVASIGFSVASLVVGNKRNKNIREIRDKDLRSKGKKAHFMAR